METPHSSKEYQENGACLLRWYHQHARELPWRGERDPYRVWISEVMLQQTRVETVIPYYQRWLTEFPDLAALAAADEQRVMQIWEGLGYYSRVRNIIAAARILTVQHDGQIPVTTDELRRLPGVGEYIAGALASIAFGADEIALDGNGLRVLSRLLEFPHPINQSAHISELRGAMRAMLPAGSAGEFNQAIMDLGSLICTARSPLCEQCPLNLSCRAREHGTQLLFPIRKAKPALPHYIVVAAVIRRQEKVLIDKRRRKGLLGGLWEFPGGKVEESESLPQALVREIREELGVELEVHGALGVYQHAYTHFRVSVHVFDGVIITGEPIPLAADEIRWVVIDDLEQYPMGKVDRLIARALLTTD